MICNVIICIFLKYEINMMIKLTFRAKKKQMIYYEMFNLLPFVFLIADSMISI